MRILFICLLLWGLIGVLGLGTILSLCLGVVFLADVFCLFFHKSRTSIYIGRRCISIVSLC